MYFAGASELDLSGSGTLTLTAPADGEQQGVLMNEASGLPGSEVFIHHSPNSFLRGLIHLPSRNFNVRGSANAVADEVSMIVNRLSTHGSSTWTFKPAPASAAEVGVPTLRS